MENHPDKLMPDSGANLNNNVVIHSNESSLPVTMQGSQEDPTSNQVLRSTYNNNDEIDHSLIHSPTVEEN